jgi:hypothetical protein
MTRKEMMYYLCVDIIRSWGVQPIDNVICIAERVMEKIDSMDSERVTISGAELLGQRYEINNKTK